MIEGDAQSLTVHITYHQPAACLVIILCIWSLKKRPSYIIFKEIKVLLISRMNFFPYQFTCYFSFKVCRKSFLSKPVTFWEIYRQTSHPLAFKWVKISITALTRRKYFLNRSPESNAFKNNQTLRLFSRSYSLNNKSVDGFFCSIKCLFAYRKKYSSEGKSLSPFRFPFEISCAEIEKKSVIIIYGLNSEFTVCFHWHPTSILEIK